MKPAFSLGAILAVAPLALAAPAAKDDNLVNPQALVDSIEQSELIAKAEIIQGFAYASFEKNRFVGTPGLQDTMEYIWDILDESYYERATMYFPIEYEGKTIWTFNIIAQTWGGDPDNVLQLGAHMDSTPEGPGMNDNASGGIGLLEIALQLATGNFTVNNAVRFSWWSAEEEGLLGSTHYVDEWLTEEDRQKIRLYLNFDMIASGAGEFGVYTSAFDQMGLTAPPGVEEAEQLFQDYFEEVGLEHKSVALHGSSDHWPFVLAGIPTGGLHAGDDPYYHTANDTVENMNKDVFFDTTKAIAHAVGTFAASFDSLPPRQPSQFVN